MEPNFSLLEPMEEVLDWWKGKNGYKKHKDYDRYEMQENILQKIFSCDYRGNNDAKGIMVKTCLLNDFYSTNIRSVYIVTEHIYGLRNEIEEGLDKPCFSLVNKIAYVNKIKRNFYSFATKYCSFHHPEHYPIFDNQVQNMLVCFKKNHKIFRDEFDYINEIPNRYNAYDSKLKDYKIFHKVINKFCEFYGLNEKHIKEVDKFLWMSGKYKWEYIFSQEGEISIRPPPEQNDNP